MLITKDIATAINIAQRAARHEYSLELAVRNIKEVTHSPFICDNTALNAALELIETELYKVRSYAVNGIVEKA